MTRDYELGFILNPEVNEEQTRAILERIEQIVNNYGGQIMRVNQWGRRRLAYPIQHNRDGFYVFIDMILTPETVSELDRTLKVSEEVLRHLIKRRDPKAVQREREMRANAAAQAASAPEGEMPSAEEGASAEEEQEVLAGAEENEAAPVLNAEESETAVVLSSEEDAFVPPAIEEETEETVEA